MIQPLMKALDRATQEIAIPGPMHLEKIEQAKAMGAQLDSFFTNDCMKIIDKAMETNPEQFERMENVSHNESFVI